MKAISVYLLAGCLLLVLQLSAQQLTKPLTVRFDNADIHLFANTLKKETGYTFYFNSQHFRRFTATFAITATLPQILEKAFVNTDFHYTIDPKGIVFLTSGAAISLHPGEGYKKSFSIPHKAPTAANKPAALPAATRQLPQLATHTADNKIYEIGAVNSKSSSNATVAGYIRNTRTGEGITAASLQVEGSRIRIVADQYGYYTLTLPKGNHQLRISSLGLADARRQIILHGNGNLHIDMEEAVTTLKAVTVAGNKASGIRNTSMGIQQVSIKTVKQLPSLMGEADIIRVLQTLPGVTSVGEGSTGLNVRGGAVDQNLVLLDGSTVFNPTHFFGLFSGFNPDVIKDAELYKSHIPARYGSRLASVLEVVTREGNRKKFAGAGGIGPLSGRLTFEGPLSKKTAFILSGRSTYSDWLLRALRDKQYNQSRAGFYDINGKITHDFNDKNSLYLAGYFSKDRFRLDGDTLYKYGNMHGILKWKHLFNNQLQAVFSTGYDRYQFAITSERDTANGYRFRFNNSQLNMRANFIYTPNNSHSIETGINVSYYKLHPGAYTPLGKNLAQPITVAPEQAVESALYISDQYNLTSDLAVNIGLRYSLFNYLGPQDVREYAPGQPRTIPNTRDTINYGAGKMIKTYHGPEPRLSVRYSLSAAAAVKVSYNLTRQYIHMLSNTTAVSPTDIWKLSDTYIRPQIGHQLAIGYYHNFNENKIEVSAEAYYKFIRHALAYKSGATLVLNQHLETDVANANGKAYGIELMLRKTTGKLTGWFNYTYSRTFLSMADPLVITQVNNGKYYPADYDKPHVANLVANYRVSHRFSIAMTANYSTGRPITLPVGKYFLDGAWRMLYSDRNQHRIPDYFRVDFSMNIEGNHRIKKLAHSSWTIGVYNLTARKNPYSIYFTTEDGKINGYKLSIFGTALPFVTYNFKF